jgi:hypothetical protein
MAQPPRGNTFKKAPVIIDRLVALVLLCLSIVIAYAGVWIFRRQATPDQVPLYYFAVSAVILLLRDVQSLAFGSWSVRFRSLEEKTEQAFSTAQDAKSQSSELEQKTEQAIATAQDAKIQSSPVPMRSAVRAKSAALGQGTSQIPISPKQFAQLNKMDEDGDPNKGRFGGKPEVNGRRLSAKVERIDNTKWFSIDLTVASTDANSRLTGRVLFYLHHTYDRSVIATLARNGVARLEEVEAYGAFTVGAVADDGRTLLELDLSELPDAPDDFKSQ